MKNGTDTAVSDDFLIEGINGFYSNLLQMLMSSFNYAEWGYDECLQWLLCNALCQIISDNI